MPPRVLVLNCCFSRRKSLKIPKG